MTARPKALGERSQPLLEPVGPVPALSHGPSDHAHRTAFWEQCLMFVSMALLLIATLDAPGLIGNTVKLVWLVSFALLTALNVGAAFGVYVAAVSLFGVWTLGGWGTVFARPDNYALVILGVGITTRMVMARSLRLFDRSTLVVIAFVGYGLIQTAIMGHLTRSNFAWYMRAFGLPMLMFVLLAQHGVTSREFRALVHSLLVIGAYSAMVSIAERLGWHDVIVPTWIGSGATDSGLEPASTVYPGRSGGLLMQPAWNAFVLSLVYCIAILCSRWSSGWSKWLSWLVGLLCLVGVFLSYTRAAWLACTLASLALLLRPSTTRSRTLLKRFGVVAASAAVLFALVVLPETIARQRIGDSGTVLFRLNLWKVALSMAADRPLVGAGFGSFGSSLGDYQREITMGYQVRISATPVHNTVLSVLVELGAIGLALYLGALVAMFRRARTAALHFWGREEAVWVAVFLGVYFIQAQFAFAHQPATNQIFFGVMGAIAGFTSRGPVFLSAEMGEAPLKVGSH